MAWRPSGEIATARGESPTRMVATSCRAATSRTETVPESRLTTSALVPSGVTATPTGPSPTRMVATASGTARSTTETVPAPPLVTRAVLPSGVTATAYGSFPTATVPTVVTPLSGVVLGRGGALLTGSLPEASGGSLFMAT